MPAAGVTLARALAPGRARRHNDWSRLAEALRARLLTRINPRRSAHRNVAASNSRVAAAMQVPVQITVRDMPHSEALEAHIRDSAAKLEQFHDRITSCRVTVEQTAQHQQQGRPFRVSVDVRVPGREIVANRDHHEDVYVALRDAFDAVKRQLEETGAEALQAKRVSGGKHHY